MNKILIIDDDAETRRIYREVLSRKGYELLEAADGDEATIRLLTHEDIQLILLDVNIPIVDGAALYDVIRLYNRRLKVIVSSVYPLEEQKKLVHHADGYYEKCEGNEALLKKVSGVLATKETAPNWPPAVVLAFFLFLSVISAGCKSRAPGDLDVDVRKEGGNARVQNIEFGRDARIVTGQDATTLDDKDATSPDEETGAVGVQMKY